MEGRIKMKTACATATPVELRQVGLQALVALLGQEPSAELASLILSEDVQGSLSAFSERPVYIGALSDLMRLLEVISSDSSGLDAVRSEYRYLFEGAGIPEVPPWESTYVSNPQLMFQQATLDVRNEYRRQGLLPERYPAVADDHVALEFSFLANLARRAAAEPDEYLANQDLTASLRFEKEHLLKWLPLYLSRMNQVDSHSFFACVIRFALEFVRADHALLSNIVQ